ncbi:hypothetical protein UFOVP344_38 [uncultured Caudovirales phage]|uniref:Phage tail collar domain containing protein n=1 Tax=uncultured Caudovirales phage TaxID=2100421 RepID=A0A6J5M0Z9_9CAUD|nr:hypothetical protein UFOVP344_38 [uncultured Caudovirales phage]
MPLETATLIHQLDAANPAATDQIRQADDHLRLIKSAIKNTFPNINAAITATDEQLNSLFVMPIGVITLWYGTSGTIPAGWGICDGSTYTRTDGAGTIVSPDLRGLVPVGANGTTFVQGTAYGALTASATSTGSGGHTHTVDGGSHTHSASATSADAPVTLSTTLAPESTWDRTGGSGRPLTAASLSGSGSHTHPITVGSSTHTHDVSTVANHTHDVTVSTLQPVRAMHYIMKI